MLRSLFRIVQCAVVVSLAAFLVISGFLYVVQDVLLFPLLTRRLISSNEKPIDPPLGIESFFVTTADGEKLESWPTWQPGSTASTVALIFHGNGETIQQKNFLGFFQEMGVPAFTFDYRGYARSTGWPSEQGLYLDAEAMWSAVKKRTGISAKQLVILGNSIGSGPAAYLASRINPKALMLIAAYSDIPTIVRDMPLYAPFAFVLRYRFPTALYLQTLKDSCIILAHGRQDRIIPFSHLAALQSHLTVPDRAHILVSDSAGHNDLYYAIKPDLVSAAKNCLR